MKADLRTSVLFTMVLTMLCSCAGKKLSLTQNISESIQNSAIFKNHHLGLAVYDLASHEMVYANNAEKYFTPASNTKLFTFYAGLKLLQDSVPALKYVINKDSLIFWGTGDPSLLHPKIASQQAFNFLANSNKKLFFAKGIYYGEVFGSGWSWDDYNDEYQTEITDLPVYGNMLNIHQDSSKKMVFNPDVKANFMSEISIKKKIKPFIKRNIVNNNLEISDSLPVKFDVNIPLKMDNSVAITLLSDTLLGTGLMPDEVNVIERDSVAINAKKLYATPTDTLFKMMLLPSDNFIAEQLLLTYAAENNLEMKTSAVIKFVKEKYLKDMPDAPQWADGSGLSRYNLFTPRDMVWLLEQIYVEVNDEKRLFNLLPAGGKTGTLKNLYKSDAPYLYAKTGSLSNVYNQSGYLITKSGKKLIFSFMNNNYTVPTAQLKTEMAKIIALFYDQYK